MPSAPATDGHRTHRQPGGVVLALHGLALGGALGLAVAVRASNHWRWGELGAILALSVLGDLRSLDTATKLRVSGSSLGVMLALVLLGPAPAMLIGVVSVAVGWLSSREAPAAFVNNLVNYAWFPLLGGLYFEAVVGATASAASGPRVYLLVFSACIIALALNFLVAAAFESYRQACGLRAIVRQVLLPLLPAQLFTALLVVAAVFVTTRTGVVGIALIGLVLVIFQYLASELLRSQRRGKQLERLASVDTLTGLANRERFQTAVGEAIAAFEPLGLSFEVLLIDLDRFKEINDALGHEYGDAVLREMGPRLRSALGSEGTVARLGGDEFALLVPSDASGGGDALASRLLACVHEPVHVDELALEVGASIGIASFPADGSDAGTLLRCADVAMYAAKHAHVGWRRYATDLDRGSVRKLSVLSDFRRALDQDELVVYYQPIVDVVNGRVRGAEALVRWEHPTLGLLAPAAFMETVEQTGLIGPLTRQVLERAIAQCAQWRRTGRELSVAVNLSVRNLLDRSLPWEIDRLLAAHALPPEALQLEITESMLMSDPERVLATVTRLNALGVRLSVDDFGTGYSSLANLRQLPIDELKIDRSFVSPMLRDESDLIIVRSTINLGHDLGLRVIAEGVEDEMTLTRLARLGCDLAQGYHVSRPMPADQFIRWLDRDSGERLALAL